jgi:tetratricopeptide (TPR) repeat protein
MKTGNDSASSRAWQRAVAALRAGDASTAEQLCRRALYQDKDNPQLLNLLGAALIQLRRPDAAEEHLRRVVQLAPATVAAHEGLAEALLQQGKAGEALKSLEIARRLEPGRSSVLVKLGGLYTALGNHDSALAMYRSLVDRSPSNVDALRLLADAACRVGLLRDAETVLVRAATLAPQRAEVWMELGRVQLQHDRFERAEHSLREALRHAPRAATAHAQLGSILVAAGQHETAIPAFEQALELDARNAEALKGLAHALSTLGQLDRAIAMYRKCIEHHPDDGAAYWGLASLKAYRFGPDEIEAMRRQLASGKLPPEAFTNLQFALATALEAEREYDAAFEHFRKGNASMRSGIQYDSSAMARIDAELIQVFDAAFLRQHGGAGNPDPAPIFIVGIPRSGSTLIEQILASHSLVEGTHELPELNRMVNAMGRDGSGKAYPALLLDAGAGRFRELGTEYLERTQRFRTDARHFTDKMSNNFRHVGLISLMLPNAKIINARRHPLDSCVSSYKMLFSRGQKFSYDLRELGEYYLQYQRLMDHWHAVLPGLVLDVDYEQLVGDVEGQVRRILDFCALPWEEECLAFHRTDRAVRTASSEQVRQPLYTTGVHRWRDYERHIGPLIDLLQPALTRLPVEVRPLALQGLEDQAG